MEIEPMLCYCRVYAQEELISYCVYPFSSVFYACALTFCVSCVFYRLA